jgi:hypothetical protein
LPSGKLHKFKDSREAMSYNMRSGNFLPMPSKEKALEYAEGGYKLGTPLADFEPINYLKRR